MGFRITIDTLPGEVVMTVRGTGKDENGEGWSMSFKERAWYEFVSAVISAAPFGVPPEL